MKALVFMALGLDRMGTQVSATFNTGDVEAAVSLASEQLEKAQEGDDLMKASRLQNGMK